MGNSCDCMPHYKERLMNSIGKSDPKYHPKLVKRRRLIFTKGGLQSLCTNEITGERMGLAVIPISNEMYYLDDKQEIIQQIKLINSQHFLKVNLKSNFFIYFQILLLTINRSYISAMMSMTRTIIYSMRTSAIICKIPQNRRLKLEKFGQKESRSKLWLGF